MVHLVYCDYKEKVLEKIIFSICVLILIFASSCLHNTIDAIAEVNVNMYLPFPITLSENDVEYGDEFKWSKGFGCYILNGDGIQIWLSGWPDVHDDYHVTEYRFTSNEYHIFGISVGNTLDDAVSVLKNHGYTHDKEKEALHGAQVYIYQKNEQVKITLQIDKDYNIYEIWVTAITTNKNNIVF